MPLEKSCLFPFLEALGIPLVSGYFYANHSHWLFFYYISSINFYSSRIYIIQIFVMKFYENYYDLSCVLNCVPTLIPPKRYVDYLAPGSCECEFIWK